MFEPVRIFWDRVENVSKEFKGSAKSAITLPFVNLYIQYKECVYTITVYIYICYSFLILLICRFGPPFLLCVYTIVKIYSILCVYIIIYICYLFLILLICRFGPPFLLCVYTIVLAGWQLEKGGESRTMGQKNDIYMYVYRILEQFAKHISQDKANYWTILFKT